MKYLASLVLLLSVPCLGQQPDKHPKVEFVVRSAVHLASMVVDIRGTQQCIASGACHEGNPLLNNSPARMYTVNAAIFTGATLFDFTCTKRRGKLCWLPSTIGTASHVVGAVSGWSK